MSDFYVSVRWLPRLTQISSSPSNLRSFYLHINKYKSLCSTPYVICFSIIILVQESLGGLLSFLNLYPFTSRISLSSLNSIRFLLVLRLIQDQPIIEMSTDLISCLTPLRSLLLILTILFSFFFRIHSIDHHLRQISRDVLPDCVSTCSSPMIDNNPNGCSNVCILPFALSSFLYHHQKKKPIKAYILTGWEPGVRHSFIDSV